MVWSKAWEGKGSGRGKGENFNNDFINTVPDMTSITALHSSVPTLDIWLWI